MGYGKAHGMGERGGEIFAGGWRVRKSFGEMRRSECRVAGISMAAVMSRRKFAGVTWCENPWFFGLFLRFLKVELGESDGVCGGSAGTCRRLD